MKIDAYNPVAGQRALSAMNERLRPAAREFQLGYDRQAGGAVMRVVDTEGGAVLRELGGAEARAIERALEYVQGMLLQVQA